MNLYTVVHVVYNPKEWNEGGKSLYENILTKIIQGR